MRSSARETVFKFIFSKLFNPDDEGLFDVLSSSLENDDDKRFAADLLGFVAENDKRYEDKITALSSNFRFNRIFKTDVCAIKIGMAELENFTETPVAVAIDEAVKRSVKYSTEKSPDFVNGVLAAFAKELKR